MNTPDIITETADYWVINKPAGLAVEPPSHAKTVRDWLLATQKINPVDWPDECLGVVHRLDTDTSGVLLWAKTPAAAAELKLLWQGRQVEKTYLALVAGEINPPNGTIEYSLKRDNKKDKQVAVMLSDPKARAAITTYRTREVGEWAGQKVSLVECHPITGRTHQIRVHLKATGHPIIGDRLYGEKATDALAQKLGLNRHFLHAWQLCLPNQACYQAPLPADLLPSLTACGIKPLL